MKIHKALLFILIVLFILGIIALIFPKEGMSIGKRTLYFPSLADIFVSKDSGRPNAFQRMKEMEANLRMKQVQDSIEYLAYRDSVSFYTEFFQNHPSRISIPDNDWHFFDRLFENLDSCKQKKEVIHILHYGDSQIEGDRISGYLRQRLQEKFGGKGPGLIPAVQTIPSSAVGQSASENISRYVITGAHLKPASHRRYGVLAQVGHIQGYNQITVASRNWTSTYENVKEFSKINLFVGRFGKDFKANMLVAPTVSVAGTVKEESPQVSVFSWELTEPIKKFTLKLHGSGEIYGIAVDGEYGVSVDNIPFRGSSGIFFTKIDSALMTSMYEQLNTQLILLEFGGNAMPAISSLKAIANYKSKISGEIAYLKTVCPKAKILLIGPADMSKRVNGKLQTYPFLEEMIEGMKDAALENGAAFWNMFEVMGGKNSMVEWVNNKPPLAAPDYIHFSIKGADKIANMLYETWMIYYDYYKFQKGHSQKENLQTK